MFLPEIGLSLECLLGSILAIWLLGIVYVLVVYGDICCQDDEENAIDEECSEIEAGVREYVDAKMGYNKQQDLSIMLFHNNQRFNQHIYWMFYEDEGFVYSPTTITLPTTTQL